MASVTKKVKSGEVGQRPAEQTADHIELAMGKIHHAHQAEHQRQAQRGKRVERSYDKAIGQELQKQIHMVHQPLNEAP